MSQLMRNLRHSVGGEKYLFSSINILVLIFNSSGGREKGRHINLIRIVYMRGSGRVESSEVFHNVVVYETCRHRRTRSGNFVLILFFSKKG